MDISNFMSWFVSQVVSIFTWIFGVLDNIQFGGTTLLRVSIIICVLIPLVGVFLTIATNPESSRVRGYYRGRESKRKENSKDSQYSYSRWI